MTWFTVYQTSDGKRVSVGTVVAPDDFLAANGLDKLQTAFDPRTNTKQWNAGTRTYDDVTPPKAPISKQEFIDLFTDAERDELFDAAENHPTANVRKKIKGFINYIQLSEHIHLDQAYIVTSVNQMEAAGIIGAGRAAEILV